MSFLTNIKSALFKTSKAISSLGGILSKRSATAEEIDELEEHLLAADFGVRATLKIIEKLKKEKIDKDSNETFNDRIKNIVYEMLKPAEKPINITDDLNVIVFCGVNGNGKTTTIGKLASKYVKMGKKVYIAACDTFRSAAVEQVKIWSKKAGAYIISGEIEADPASVAYKAMKIAKEDNADILLIDTAGRLHNKKNLMSELTKIINVLKKIDNTSPHHIILTLDSTTGQNALVQAKTFFEIVNVSGLIFTKLDGSAKAGSIIGITDELNLPVYFISTGEKIGDILEFNRKDYVDALFS